MNAIDQLTSVAKALEHTKSILFITGAGISADSGLPTYRGIGGLYEDQPTEDGVPIEVALAGQMLRERPEVTWKYLSQIETNCRKARYNQAHQIITHLERTLPRVWTLTQNIDGFHADAGSNNLIEIHGNLHRLRCDACGWKDTVADYSHLSIPPKCPTCERIARPDVVFFGEMLPEEACATYAYQLRQGFDAYIWIGTTAVFPYIQQPLMTAQRQGSLTIEINPGETSISNLVDHKISLTASKALEALWPLEFTLS